MDRQHAPEQNGIYVKDDIVECIFGNGKLFCLFGCNYHRVQLTLGQHLFSQWSNKLHSIFVFNPQIAGNAWMLSQHCVYCCSGAKAPGHRYPHYRENIHCIGLVSYSVSFMVNNFRKITF